MNQPTVASDKLAYLAEQSRAEKWARTCFKAAIFLRMVQPVLVFGGAVFLIVLSTVSPVAGQTGGPIISGGNPNAPITGIQNLVTLGVWLLIAAGIGGIGWALINGMRRQSWGAQLIFGAACLGFGGIVALWNEYANGRSPDLPAF
jgi:hypothetical protein